MADLGPIPWPPPPLRTDRLVLREPEPRDRAAMIDLYASVEVFAHLGGPRSRDELEATVPATPSGRPGRFVVAQDSAMIGIVTLGRHDAARPGHVRPGGHEVELSYLFLPQWWGHGYAAEACAAALDWCSGVLPDEPVVVVTQVANTASRRLAERLGFTEVARYEEFGEQQWFGVRRPGGGVDVGRPPASSR